MPQKFLRKYGVAATLPFTLFEMDGIDFQINAIHAAGDTKVMKDEATEINTTNGFTDEGTGYAVVLSATEMEAKRNIIYIIDQEEKTWLDDYIVIESYGHANAMHPFDLGADLSGNNVNWKFKSIDITNDAGTALISKSTGGDGKGMDIAGNGSGDGIISTGGDTGHGLYVKGGSTSGHGLNAWAQTNGNGIQAAGGGGGAGLYVLGQGVGNGLWIVGGDTNAHGLRADGKGTGEGISCQGGLTGNGFHAIGGATSGDGFLSSAFGNGHGIHAIGKDNLNGIYAEGDTNGAGIRADGGSGGPGMDLRGGTTGTGLQIVGGPTSGHGISVTTTYGIGLNINGSGANEGIRIIGGTGKPGIYSQGGTTGAGIHTKGGITGSGVLIEGGVDGGHGIESKAGASSNGNGFTMSGNGTGKDIDALEIDTLIAGHVLIDGKIDIIDNNVDSIVAKLPAGNISDFALDDTIDGVKVQLIFQYMMAMFNGKFTEDDPAPGQKTFFKRNNVTELSIVSVTENGRTRDS